jgi:hypothetical protein
VLDRLVLEEIVTGSLHQNRAALQHIANVCDLQRLSHVLFDEKNGDAFAIDRFLFLSVGIFGSGGSWQANGTLLSPL